MPLPEIIAPAWVSRIVAHLPGRPPRLALVLALNTMLSSMENPRADRSQIKQKVKDELSKFLYSKTKRRPMVLPIVMYV